MSGPSRHPDAPDEAGTPLWVKVFGIIALVGILLFILLLLAGGPGGHGPGRHLSFDGAEGHAPLPSLASQEGAPSAGELPVAAPVDSSRG